MEAVQHQLEDLNGFTLWTKLVMRLIKRMPSSVFPKDTTETVIINTHVSNGRMTVFIHKDESLILSESRKMNEE